MIQTLLKWLRASPSKRLIEDELVATYLSSLTCNDCSYHVGYKDSRTWNGCTYNVDMPGKKGCVRYGDLYSKRVDKLADQLITNRYQLKRLSRKKKKDREHQKLSRYRMISKSGSKLSKSSSSSPATSEEGS